MAEVIPFRAILYNRDKVAGDDVIAPPYDIITPAIRQSLYAKSPYNIARIDSGMEMEGDGEAENKYTRAARLLEQWSGEDVLMRGERPAFYAYRMRYRAGGVEKAVSGFFGLVRVEELGKWVYPHEATHSKPKSDRLALTQALGANTCPIFSLYDSPGAAASGVVSAATEAKPLFEARDMDGTLHSLWPVEDPAAIDKIRGDLSDKAVFIADGHHRYETALAYRQIMREKEGPSGAFDFVLMFFANMAVEELTIFPTHRLIDTPVEEELVVQLCRQFSIETLPPDADLIEAIKGKKQTFGLYSGGESRILSYRGGELDGVHPALSGLDVTVLHEVIFKEALGISGCGYEMDYALARAKVDDGTYGAAFFLNPTDVKDVESVALSMQRMPPKSTYFYPKVPAGFVINSLRSF